MYLHAFDRDQAVGAWVRIGNRVNEGHAEMTCCVYLPDGRVGFMFKRPTITSNDRMSAGGMTFDVVEAFKELHVTYDGELLLMERPEDMTDPGKAFKSNPKVHCKIDLRFTGVSPVHGGEIVNLDGSPWDLDPETSVFRGHIEQHMATVGEIVVEDVVYKIDGFGYRDKSWGPRHWQNFYWYKWLPVTFGPDFGVMLAYMGRPDGPPFVSGNVFVDGELLPITGCSVENEYDEDYYPVKIVARLDTPKKCFVLEGETLSMIPLRHRRNMADGSISNARITEGMTRYTCEGRVATGMSEYLDLMVDERPLSVILEEQGAVET